MAYKCDDCNKIYKNKEYLQEHITIKHSTIESLECGKCDKQFSNQRSLKRHLYQVHRSKLHSCNFCGSSFKASWKVLSLIECIKTK